MSDSLVKIGERAAGGDQKAMDQVLENISSRALAATTKGGELAKILTDLKSLSTENRERLLTVSRTCCQVGDYELAEAFRIIAINGTLTAQKVRLEICSKKRRHFRLLRLNNSYVRIPEVAREVDAGYLPTGLILESNTSYLLIAETTPDEPKIFLPLSYVGESAPDPIDIDLSAWENLGGDFVWLPRMTCAIGGDRGARDSLSTTRVQVGPLIVDRKHVTIRDYLSHLDAMGQRTNNELIPSYMGEALTVYNNGNWECDGIAVREFHNWLLVPVVGVNFDCAIRYCSSTATPSHLRCGLLSEREWEVLARGPDLRLFPWGDIGIAGFANIRVEEQKSAGLESVGYRRTDCSAFGLYDCSGNAEEWCVLDGSNPTTSKFAVARGGSWYNPEQASRLASRVVRDVEYRHRKLTFRRAIRLR